MFVVFEGIDGSGKTTVSSKVARALRARGIEVEHVREDGVYSSTLVSRMREFGKDSRNLTMEPLAELLLYCARDAQLLAEHIRPALDRGALVFADRYLYSHRVLAEMGRLLPADQVRPVIETVSGGLWPDLVVLMDVDPFVARARRQVSKLLRKAGPRKPKRKNAVGGSRKGLAGVGIQHRMRAGYLSLADEDPERWMVIDNSDPTSPKSKLKAVAATIADTIAHMWQTWQERSGAKAPSRPARPRPRPRLPLDSLSAGRDAFYAAVQARARRERDVAAYFLAGLSGDRAFELRHEWADDSPHAVAYGLRGLGDDRAWELRELLRFDAPHHVARSLAGPEVEGARAAAMREALFSSQPEAVLGTLGGNDSHEAWRLRERYIARGEEYGEPSYLGRVVASLRGIEGDRAWALRERLAAGARDEAGDDLVMASHLVKSLRGMAGERAWELRRRYLDLVPAVALASLAGLEGERAWELRQRYVERAPKIVLRSIDGSRDPRAYALRAAHAPRIKEALDSMIGLDDDEAWAIRRDNRDIWPSTAVKSLGLLGASERGRDLARYALAHHPANISLLKHSARLCERIEEASGGSKSGEVVDLEPRGDMARDEI